MRMRGVPSTVAIFFATCAYALASLPANAQSLQELLVDVLNNHERVLAAERDLAAAREGARAALGDWYPTVDVTTSYGFEEQRKASADDTHLPFYEFDVSLNQLLWDFGKTNATVHKARLAFEQAQAAYNATRQGTLLEAITAYVGLNTANKVVQFAVGSESNIKRQTELEDARVKRGSGFSTDVLQAKTQLAGAQARRAQAEGALQAARNRYRAVYYKAAKDINSLTPPRFPADLIPSTLDDVVKLSLEKNPLLKASSISAEIARESVRETKADEFYPTLNGVAEAKYKENSAGTVGFKGEQLAKVELTWDINLGMTARNTLNAARHTSVATTNRYKDARHSIEEQARNAWQQLQTAKENAEFLRNQANIAGEFLELARKERQLGRRSLIDVLAGETALINASSDSVSAENEVITRAYELINVMGLLELDVVADK